MTPFANIFQPLIDLFNAVILFFHDSVGLSWGFAIIALTVSVRALMLPLAFKQFHSMQALLAHGPEIKALQERYKDDRQRLNEEMMKFYRENKVNPFSSCLPLLAQLPVFFSLFYALQGDLRQDICGQDAEPCGSAASWWFIPDLTDSATGGVLAVLLILYVGTQLISSLLMMTTADRTQRTIMIVLPLVIVPFVINFPAGLLLYWITTNLWTMGQQWVLRKSAGYEGWAANVVPDHIREARQGTKTPAAARAAAPTRRSRATDAEEADGAQASEVGATRRRSGAPPPPPPRKKKKRSGRRR